MAKHQDSISRAVSPAKGGKVCKPPLMLSPAKPAGECISAPKTAWMPAQARTPPGADPCLSGEASRLCAGSTQDTQNDKEPIILQLSLSIAQLCTSSSVIHLQKEWGHVEAGRPKRWSETGPRSGCSGSSSLCSFPDSGHLLRPKAAITKI